MVPEKGAHRAIRIARRAGWPLRIAAKMREPAEQAFFDAEVRPLLGGDIEYVGELGSPEKRDLLCGAVALLNPIDWPEPFGMVMLEALACGTPVVARAVGAAPEIVGHGEVGFLGRTDDDLTAGSCTRRRARPPLVPDLGRSAVLVGADGQGATRSSTCWRSRVDRPSCGYTSRMAGTAPGTVRVTDGADGLNGSHHEAFADALRRTIEVLSAAGMRLRHPRRRRLGGLRPFPVDQGHRRVLPARGRRPGPRRARGRRVRRRAHQPGLDLQGLP